LVTVCFNNPTNSPSCEYYGLNGIISTKNELCRIRIPDNESQYGESSLQYK
jgi:hypothetical protein